VIRYVLGPAVTTSPQAVLEQLADYATPGLNTTYGLHSLHPYPAKFIPQIPADIISAHTNERHLVFDPFCGSGTTLAEAQRLGRRSIGSDSNPIAALISRAKTTPQTSRGVIALEALAEWCKAISSAHTIPFCDRPDHPALEHWFQERVTDELAYLLNRIREIEDAAARQLAECVFSSIIVSVSNQESDTRYAAVPKPFNKGDVFRRFVVKLKRAIELAPAASSPRSSILTPTVYLSDIRRLDASIIPDNTADLVVTSPPYANSYDYYLYHKWRMVWMGASVKDAQNDEIGSRHEHSSKRAPISVFEAKMSEALTNISRILKPNKLAYFLIGDSILNGELIDSAESLRRIATETNLQYVESIAYPLDQVSRSFREKVGADQAKGSLRPAKQQRILVFEATRSKVEQKDPSRKIAAVRSTRDEIELKGPMSEGGRIALKSSDKARHIHSLARYPSKFVPAIPRWAIETFSPEQGVVLDPFSGSGTTSVEALCLGRSAIGCDVSPFSCLVTRAKTTKASEDAVQSAAAALKAAASEPARLPSAERLSFDLDTFWFEEAHLEEFARLKAFIDTEIDPTLRDFFHVSLASTIRAFSYQDEAQIKVKRDNRKLISGTPSPSTLLLGRLPKDCDRLVEFNRLRSPLTSDVFLRSADRVDEVAKGVDLVVTSPPYINAMNYPMTHRYENVLLGLIDHDEKRDHEKEYFGSERVSAADYKTLRALPSDYSSSASVNAALEQIYALEPKRSYIAYKFFADMWNAVKAAKATLKPNGHMVMVVGRNRIKGVPLDTFGILASFMADQGMSEVTRFEYEIFKNSLKLTRHKTADVISYDGVAVFRNAG